MACEHEENESIDQEKGKLTLPQAAPAVIQHGATTINVYIETGHANANEKLNSTLEALDLVAKNTLRQLNALDLYLGANCRCIAYLGETGGNRSYTLFLGDQMMQKTAKSGTQADAVFTGGFGMGGERGIADQVYDDKRKSTWNPARWFMSDYQKSKVSAKMCAVVVHEMGHILHEGTGGATYWGLKMMRRADDLHAQTDAAADDRPPANIAVKVSQYATKSKLEFTAEVFTGLVYGKQYDDDVLQTYVRYGGSSFPGNPKTAPEQ
jgi:hypothetical protein